MKFYFAGAGPKAFTDILRKEKANKMLFSYFDFQNSEINKIDEKDDFFLDSGAFSAWSIGKKIDIYTYRDYLKIHKDIFTVYANLDVIGDPKKTLKNQKIIEEVGLKPLPTIHFNSDLKYLRYYIENYDYLALGGLVPYSKKPLILKNWLNKCFKILIPHIIKKNIKVHGFGVGTGEILKEYPFYSSDSTGWLIGGQFGSIVDWDSQKCRMLTSGHFKDKNVYLKKGGNLKLFENYKERNKHNVQQYLKMERDITKLWEYRGIKWN